MQWNTARWPLVEYRILAKGIRHSIRQPLMEESQSRKRHRCKRRCASTCARIQTSTRHCQGRKQWSTARWPSVECRTLAKGISHSIKQPLVEESLCRKLPRSERRCASTRLGHWRLYDPAGLECGETLHGDGSYEASERKKNMEYLWQIAFLHVNINVYPNRM